MKSERSGNGEDKKTARRATRETLRRILGYMRPYWLQFLLIFLTILASALLGLLPVYYSGELVNIIDTSTVSPEEVPHAVRLLVMAILTAVASNSLRVIETMLSAWISQHVIFDIKSRMYRHMQFMHHGFFTTRNPGDIITRMTTDIEGVNAVISGTLASVVNDFVIVATTVANLFFISWPLTLMGLFALPFLVLPNRIVGKAKWKLLSVLHARHDESNRQIEETLTASGSHLIKLYTREDAEFEKFQATLKEVMELSIREQRAGKWFNAALGTVNSLSTMLIYGAGAVMILINGHSYLSISQITKVTMNLNRLYKPTQNLLNTQVLMTRSLALFNRIFEYLDLESDVKDPELPVKADLTSPRVEFDSVSFAYEPGVNVLTDISFSVPSGKMYALVGPSGSGKSTIVNLLPRLFDPASGRVLINGTDVRQIPLARLRGSIGVVTQETFLFNGTIRDNLLFAKPGATDSELEEACRAANILDFIRSQPDGMSAMVGNRGLKLSGGEKQRLSIARVILKNPDLLILDEATSSLDSISESLVQEAFSGIMKNRTCIVIAHRLSTILSADRIIVINAGRIAEQGRHSELLSKNSVYRELFDTQFKNVLDTAVPARFETEKRDASPRLSPRA